MPSESFRRGATILAAGSIAGQALPILATPLLTRLYTPAEFGVFAVLLALATFAAAVIAGRYELAIVVADTERDARLIATFAISLAGAATVILSTAVWLFEPALVAALGVPELGLRLLLAPLLGFFLCAFNIFNYLATRSRRYCLISYSHVTKGASASASQLAIGVSNGAGGAGLTTGQLVGTALSVILLARGSGIFRRDSWDWSDQWRQARVHKKFPLYSMPANLANVAAINSPNLLLPSIYSLAQSGHFVMLQRLLGAPSVLVANAVGQAFYGEAARAIREGQPLLARFDSTLIRLTLLSGVTFGAAYWIAPPLLPSILGPDWAHVSQLVRIMIPLFAIRFVVAALSTTTSLYQRQGTALMWQTALLLTTCIVLALAFLWAVPFTSFLMMYTWSLGACYALLLIVMREIVRGEDARLA